MRAHKISASRVSPKLVKSNERRKKREREKKKREEEERGRVKVSVNKGQYIRPGPSARC